MTFATKSSFLAGIAHTKTYILKTVTDAGQSGYLARQLAA
jgi:hypothetical protein